MHERELTRVDNVRDYVDEMLNNSEDIKRRRNGFVHLYGVGQACALIALHRGHDRKYAELAQIAGMLHDFSKYYDGIEEKHAEKSGAEARRILTEIGRFSEEEIEMVANAISRHSSKKRIDTEFDEIVKDGDEMQHWLRNPIEEHFFNKERNQKLAKEFELIR